MSTAYELIRRKRDEKIQTLLRLSAMCKKKNLPVRRSYHDVVEQISELNQRVYKDLSLLDEMIDEARAIMERDLPGMLF